MAKKKKKTGAQARAKSRGRLPALVGALAVVCALALAFVLTRPAKLELPYLTAQCVAVMEVDSGKFIYEKAADEAHSPGSVTKLMTMLLALEDVESGALDWEDTWTVTEREADTPGSKYGMRAGEEFTLRQLMAGIALPSGCDCVQCLMGLEGGDEAAFVERMNRKAEELGLEDSRFANPAGLDSEGHYMTAKDIAVLAAELVEEFPEVLDYTSQGRVEVGGRTFSNTNRLAGKDPRVLGLKTGTTRIGGFNLVTYARQDGEDYIIVLLDSDSDTSRFSETVTILDTIWPEA